MPAVQNEANGLSVEERAVFFEVIEPTLSISNQEQFFRWTQTDLQRIFPHGMLACGMGRIGKKGVKARHVMGCNFPQEYMQTLQRPNGLMNSPILAKWMKERQPILFEPNYGITTNATQTAWLDNFRRFGLTNLAAHGQCDVSSKTASYYSFSGIPGPLSPRHACLLKLLVPHLHVALARVVATLPAKAHKRAPLQSQLTGREKEVLKCLCDGRTNWEIAQVLSISEATVKNHVHRVLAKLNVSSRTQAVTKAINLIHTKLALFFYAGAELLLQMQVMSDIYYPSI